ncbi:ADP-ribose glycohydrolase ARH3 [Folsomia candida]|uniref:ADP-ribose glycohydrolase ARH3 n=1 Tax=Folsomia candida TaxID=158441 RepID=UPI0016053CDB|nr:ADP-ribose glycohydrolase ARH3 [Folsomia candida]
MRKSYLVRRCDADDESGQHDEGGSSSWEKESSKPLLNLFKGVQPKRTTNSISSSMEDRLRDKMRGCLVGSLVGDCIGTLFECDYTVSYSILGDLYLSLTNLSEDEKLMDLHGIDFSVGPKLAQQMLERKRASIVPIIQSDENGDSDHHNNTAKGPIIQAVVPPKRHSSFERRRESFSRPIEKFSDDTVMIRSVVRSLIRMRGLDQRDMATQLTDDYFLNLSRKYGAFSREIFTQIRNSGYSDPVAPARKSVGNIGAQGNEGATRVAPVALFGWNLDFNNVAEMATKLTKITNYHKSAVIGAACQALSVHKAFNWDLNPDGNTMPTVTRGRLGSRLTPTMKRKIPKQENIPMNAHSEMDFDYREFCQQLIEEISHVESKNASFFENFKSLMSSHREIAEIGESAYIAKINTIVEFMDRSDAPSRAEVVEKLGNAVKAIDSVPTALFSFLMSATKAKFTELPVHIKSPVLKSIFYAISLGGDSDTTASMAGAISGAYWGYNSIPQEILRVCEGANDAKNLADELFNHCHNNSNN